MCFELSDSNGCHVKMNNVNNHDDAANDDDYADGDAADNDDVVDDAYDDDDDADEKIKELEEINI